jgi:hypothetical protein
VHFLAFCYKNRAFTVASRVAILTAVGTVSHIRTGEIVQLVHVCTEGTCVMNLLAVHRHVSMGKALAFEALACLPYVLMPKDFLNFNYQTLV